MKKNMTQEANVKAGISVNRGLAEDADTLAREMGVTRSGLYAMALREFIRRHESASLLEKLNEVYREPDPEDESLLRGIKRHGRRAMNEEDR